jgi:hypothetical protein
VQRAPGGHIEVRSPKTAADLDIPISLVHDLVLRQAMLEGRTSTIRLSTKLALSLPLMTSVIEELRELRYLEVQGLEGRDYLLALTDAGRQQATDRMQLSRYAGAAPVALDLYTEVITAQHASPTINFAAMQHAFSDLVISDELLWELGPAAIAGGAMFLYGPPGTGKSSIAERLLRIYEDMVLVPHAVEVDGQIITVYDPVVHRPVADQPTDVDPRWVLCERPCIIVGGELVGSMLDLTYQNDSGIYLAPVQMQANNGILVIDDFGRQSLTPEQLLNRWIVPLDRQIDYLSLDYGMKFEVPFDAKIVFSTNLNPETLGDEAFFRRIQSKILIPTIEDDQFDEVLHRVARAMQVELAPGAEEHLRFVSRNRGDGDLRPYLPAAVLKHLKAICAFADLPLVLDSPMIDRVAQVYFTHAGATSGASNQDPAAAPPTLTIPVPTAAPGSSTMETWFEMETPTEAGPADTAPAASSDGEPDGEPTEPEMPAWAVRTGQPGRPVRPAHPEPGPPPGADPIAAGVGATTAGSGELF